MGNNRVFLEAENELRIIENQIQKHQNLTAKRAGILFLNLSEIMDDILHFYAVKISHKERQRNHAFLRSILYRYVKALHRLCVFCRLKEGPLLEVHTIHSLARSEAASYMELYTLICRQKSKKIILKHVLEKSKTEQYFLQKYYSNHDLQSVRAKSRDAVYQVLRLHLSAKIYVLNLFYFLKNKQSELVQDMARYTPFAKKFGYREKMFTCEKLLKHTSPIEASVLGQVDAKNSQLNLMASTQVLDLVNTPTVILNKLNGQYVIATGLFDGRKDLKLSEYAKFGTYGWIVEFFGISTRLEPSDFSTGNPIIELI
jgi:hypothetical protein